MKSGRIVLAVAAMTCAWIASGCTGSGVFSNPQEATIEREVNLDGRTAVVIPFQEKGGAYFESADGTELAERVNQQMMANMPKTRFVSAMGARVSKSMLPAEMGYAAGADVVVTGNLTEMRTQEPKTQGILRGTCSAQVTVYDVKAMKTIKSWAVTVRHPERGEGIPETDTTQAVIRDAVLKRTGDLIAKKFYTWKKSLGAQQVEW